MIISQETTFTLVTSGEGGHIFIWAKNTGARFGISKSAICNLMPNRRAELPLVAVYFQNKGKLTLLKFHMAMTCLNHP